MHGTDILLLQYIVGKDTTNNGVYRSALDIFHSTYWDHSQLPWIGGGELLHQDKELYYTSFSINSVKAVKIGCVC